MSDSQRSTRPEDVIRSSGIDRFVFLRSLGESDGSVRIHMMAVERALRASPGLKTEVVTPETSSVEIREDDCLVLYYNDLWATQMLMSMGVSEKCALAMCFGSDIRSFAQYRRLSKAVDCFLMPSALHREILALGVDDAVEVVREGIDPAGGGGSFRVNQLVSGNEGPPSLVWFGYGEGFLPGMWPYLEVLKRCKVEGKISRFASILNRRGLDPRVDRDIEVVEYSQHSIGAQLASFDYVILSHFPGDLSINAYIKSPNKLVTALNLGVLPIATDTPNYRSLMTEFGLDDFLFTSPGHLSSIISRLNPSLDRQRLSNLGIRERLNASFGDEMVLVDFLHAAARAKQRKSEIAVTDRQTRDPIDHSFVGFGAHMKDLVPSALRAIRKRVAMYVGN